MKLPILVFTTALVILAATGFSQEQNNDKQKNEGIVDMLLEYKEKGRGPAAVTAGIYGTNKILDFKKKPRMERAKIIQRPVDVFTFQLERRKPTSIAKRIAVGTERRWVVRGANALMVGGFVLSAWDAINLIRESKKPRSTAQYLNRQR